MRSNNTVISHLYRNIFLFTGVLLVFAMLSQSAHAGGFAGLAGSVFGTVGKFLGGSTGTAWLDRGGCSDAGTLGFVICNLVFSFEGLPIFLSALSYLFAVFLGFFALLKLKDHVLDPRSVPLWEPVKRAFASGLFFAFPYLLHVLINSLTLGIGVGGPQELNVDTSASAGSLDGMLMALALNLSFPMAMLVNSFAWISGLIFIMVGISRMLKSSQDGPRGPAGMGTMMTFLVGSVLLSVPNILAVMSNSLFVSEGYNTYAVLQSSAGLETAQVAHVQNVISAVLTFAVMVGWVSFTRGFFILREHSEGGGQASLMAAFTHILAGTLAVNLGPLLNVVQITLGIERFGVIFTPG